MLIPNRDVATAAARPGFVAAAMIVIRKDLVLEWRGRSRVNATIFFALLTLLLFSFAMGANPDLLATAAPGLYWLAIFLASVLSLGESFRIEMENDALEGLRLLAMDPRALFLGKALVNTLSLFVVGLVLVPVTVALYGVSVNLGLPLLLGVLLLGSAAISAPGTLYAAIVVQARARDVLLPLLLFPLLVPALVAAVKATSLVMRGDGMNELDGWLSLLGGFAGIYWFLGTLLFDRALEQ